MKSVLFVLLGLSAPWLSAQRMLPESEAIELALKNSPAIQSAELQTQQSQAQQKSAFNLPNPDVMAESPTGEFYTIGVQQSMEFPTVYYQQVRLQKERTQLAVQEQALTQADIRYRIRVIYVNAQYQTAVVAQLRLQDSVFNAVNNSAQRRFTAGEIDVLEKTSAELQYGQIHSLYSQAQADLQSLLAQLQLYTGLQEPLAVAPLQKAASQEIGIPYVLDTASLRNNIRLEYYSRVEAINRRTLKLERQRLLPGITFGYLNQGPLNTPLYYRFRAGITVPLWFWQYSGNIRAAKLGVQIAHQQYLARQQELSAELLQARNDLFKSLSVLQYYESTALLQAQTIIAASQRYFQSGETEYTMHLRTMGDAYAIQRAHLDAIRDYNMAAIRLNYLNGN
jgi:outer membrane protein, heavy metal efflux system